MPRDGRREDEERERQLTLLKFLGLSEVFEPEPPEEIVDGLLSIVELPGLGKVFRCRACGSLYVGRDDFERHRGSPDPGCAEKRVELLRARRHPPDGWALGRAVKALGLPEKDLGPVCPRCGRGIAFAVRWDGREVAVRFSCSCGWSAVFACSLADFWREVDWL